MYIKSKKEYSKKRTGKIKDFRRFRGLEHEISPLQKQPCSSDLQIGYTWLARPGLHQYRKIQGAICRALMQSSSFV